MNKKTLTGLAAAAAAVAFTGAAQASNYDNNYDNAYSPAGHDSYGRPNDYMGDDYRYHYHGGRYFTASCREVTSRRYRHHGRRALYSGIQCVDDYGCSWILEGSRHFVRYLDSHHGYSPSPRSGYDDGY